jgi:acyl-CoA reductase-like NAD-dependent aldehyde dehydrogenase
VAAAKAAFPAWSKTTLDERKAAINAMADAIEKNGTELARLLTQEQGNPWPTPRARSTAPPPSSATSPPSTCRRAWSRTTATSRVEVRRKPLGVVGCIIPWNFPMILLGFKLPAALLAGNTVIVKPAPTTPLTALSSASSSRTSSRRAS